MRWPALAFAFSQSATDVSMTHRLEHGTVHLLADLQRVAAVDEDRRLVGEHDGRAGRAGEAGQPGEPLGRFRHIFALVLVGARHDEAVERQLLQLGAEQRRRARRLWRDRRSR